MRGPIILKGYTIQILMTYDSYHLNHVNQSIQDLFLSPLNVDDTVLLSPSEVSGLISNLPKKKSSGPDSISMEHMHLIL